MPAEQLAALAETLADLSATPPPPAKTGPSPVVDEVTAMGAIVAILEELPPVAAARVLAHSVTAYREVFESHGMIREAPEPTEYPPDGPIQLGPPRPPAALPGKLDEAWGRTAVSTLAILLRLPGSAHDATPDHSPAGLVRTATLLRQLRSRGVIAEIGTVPARRGDQRGGREGNVYDLSEAGRAGLDATLTHLRWAAAELSICPLCRGVE